MSSVNLRLTLQKTEDKCAKKVMCLPLGIFAKRGKGTEGQSKLKEGKGKQWVGLKNYKSRACESRDFILSHTFSKGKGRCSPETRQVTKLERGFPGYSLEQNCSVLSRILSCSPFPHNSQQTTNPMEKKIIWQAPMWNIGAHSAEK